MSKMRCRTCLQDLDITSSSSLRKSLSLGKTVEEIILLFIPEMVKSKTANEYICRDCMDAVQVFVNFIERCISAEKYLKEESIKENLKQQNTWKDQSFVHITDEKGRNLLKIVSIKTENIVNEVVKPLHEGQQQSTCNSVNSPEGFIKPLKTYSRKRKISPVIPEQQVLKTSSPSISIGSLKVNTYRNLKASVEKKDESSEKTKDMVSVNSTSEPLGGETSELSLQKSGFSNNSTPSRTCLSKENTTTNMKVIDKASKKIGNLVLQQKLYEHMLDIFESNSKQKPDRTLPEVNLTTFENSVLNNSIVAKENRIKISGLLNEKLLNSSGDSAYFNKVLENTSLIKTMYFTRMDSCPYVDHDRILSVPKTNREIANFVKIFSQYRMNLMKLPAFKESPTKRILLLGESIDYCPECKIWFTSERALRFHFGQVHPDLSYPAKSDQSRYTKLVLPYQSYAHCKMMKECPVCKGQFPSGRKLTRHISHEHKDYYPFQCEVCKSKFKKKATYTAHCKLYETYKDCSAKKCYVCREVVTRKSFKEHYATHKNLECNICKRRFILPSHLNKHYLAHQNVVVKTKKTLPRHLCPVCGKILFGQANFRSHMVSHSQNRSYLCEKCPKSFKTITALKKHVETVHTEAQRYECLTCHKQVKSKSSLIYHIKLKHTKECKRICQICGEGFLRGDYYKRHLLHHANFTRNTLGHLAQRTWRKYRCKSGMLFPCKYCHRKYKLIYQLRTHILASHLKSKRRDKCEYCDMTFAGAANKFRHQKRHKNQDKFDLTCKVCYNLFSSKEELEVHALKHDSTPKRECEKCGEMLPSKHLLMHHMNEKHYSQELVDQEKVILLEEGLSDFLIEESKL